MPDYPQVRVNDAVTVVEELGECRICGQVRHRTYTVEIVFNRAVEDNNVAVCARCLQHGWPVSMAANRDIAEALARALPPEGIDIETLLA
jgi:hypothetical protein